MAKTNKTKYLGASKLTAGIVTAEGSPVSFGPVEQDSAIAWMNTDRVYKLWDISYKFGQFIPMSSPATIVYHDPKRLIGVYVTSEEVFIQALGGTKGTSPEWHEFVLKNGLKVRWDKRVSIIIIDNWIFETYRHAQTKKAVNNGILQLQEHEVDMVAMPA